MTRKKKIALIALLFFLFFGIILAGFIWELFFRQPYVGENSYLYINLQGTIEADTPEVLMPFSREEPALRDLFWNLVRAKNDPRIKKIFFKIGQVDCGYATLRELGELLRVFESGGKEAIAYVQGGGIKEFYLASFAKKRFFQRGFPPLICGLAAEALFFKKGLKKLGIEAEFFHTGEYKTYANAFTQEQLTPEHRESLQTLLNDFQETIAEDLEKNLGLRSASEFLKNAPYSEEKLNFLNFVDSPEKIIEQEFSHLNKVNYELYTRNEEFLPYSGEKKIAIYFAGGEINSGESGQGGLFGGRVLGADTAVKILRQLGQRKDIAAVVLRIDSPGGSALASELIYQAIKDLRSKKPVIVSMGDVAASGGYWISLAADKIFAYDQTITASIGVISGKFILRGLYDKLGINKEILTTGPAAAIYSDYQSFSPEEKEYILSQINAVYRNFKDRVKESTGLSIDEIERLAQGRAWSGRRALQLHLVQKRGGLGAAISEAARMAGLRDFSVELLPEKRSLLSQIVSSLFSARSDDLKSYWQRFASGKNFFILSRMPYDLKIL